MKTNFLYVGLAVMFFLSACSSDSIMEEIDNSVLLETNVTKSSSTFDVIRNLKESFKNNVTRTLDNSYPSYYGGMYVNEDNILVVQIVGADSIAIKNDLALRAKSSQFQMNACKYSYNELLSTAKNLEAYMISHKEDPDNIKFYGFCIRDKENDIEIKLGDSSAGNIEKFKSLVLDKEYFSYSQSKQMVFESELLLGQSIYYLSWGSLGFRARRTDGVVAPVDGFVTAGHVTKSVGTEIYADNQLSETIGVTELWRIGGNMDASFCRTTNNYAVTNQLYQDITSSVTPELASYAVGSTVNLRGRHNASSGVITTTYATWTISGVTLSGLVGSYYQSQSGDSGGLIYTPDDMRIAGIHTAGAVDSGYGVRYFTPAEAIVSYFGLTLY